MATFYWEGYMGSTPDWTDLGSNTICFTGDAANIDTPITVGEWNSGTHAGDDDPGTDQCGTNHMNNVKIIASGTFDNGGGTENLDTSNLTPDECTLRIRFTDASAVECTSARLYSFDGGTVTNEAVGVEAYAWECQPSGVTTWTLINDDSANIGGDNSSERLDLLDQAASTEHHYYVALSVRPESVGAKTSFDFGIALTYS